MGLPWAGHQHRDFHEGAAELLQETLPQDAAVDHMFVWAIRGTGLAAYQPREPIFRQDRNKFSSEVAAKRTLNTDFAPEGCSGLEKAHMALLVINKYKAMSMKGSPGSSDPRDDRSGGERAEESSG